MSLGKVKLVQTVQPGCPGKMANRQSTIDARQVGGIEIINIGVIYTHQGRQVVVPWAGIRWLELEGAEAEKAGKGRTSKTRPAGDAE